MTSVSESAGSVQICVRIVEGMLAVNKDVTLVLQTMDGTASGNLYNDTSRGGSRTQERGHSQSQRQK